MFVVEAGVVGGEVAHLLLDDGMAAVFDMDDGVVGELGADEAAFGGGGGEGGEYVEGGSGFGGFLKLGKGRLNVFEEGFKQAFFPMPNACSCAVKTLSSKVLSSGVMKRSAFFRVWRRW